MRNYLLTITLSCFAIHSAFAQKINTSEKDVFAAHEIIFFGYDYSHFRLADGNRINQDAKKFILNWIADSQTSIPENEMASRTYLGKENVIYDFDPTLELAKKLISEDIVSFTGHQISKDSIQSFINRYHINEKEGIGFVVIVECFNKSNKTVSGYCTFFDISTKKLLMADYFLSKNADNYNKVNDWGNALNIALRKYMWDYYRKQKEFRASGS